MLDVLYLVVFGAPAAYLSGTALVGTVRLIRATRRRRAAPGTITTPQTTRLALPEPEPEPEVNPLAFWLYPDWSGGHNLRDPGTQPFWMLPPKLPEKKAEKIKKLKEAKKQTEQDWLNTELATKKPNPLVGGWTEKVYVYLITKNCCAPVHAAEAEITDYLSDGILIRYYGHSGALNTAAVSKSTLNRVWLANIRDVCADHCRFCGAYGIRSSYCPTCGSQHKRAMTRLCNR